MTFSFRQLMSILVLALVLTSNGVYADQEWLDATHLFEAEVREAVVLILNGTSRYFLREFYQKLLAV